MEPWLVEALMIAVLVLAAASGLWVWVALGDRPRHDTGARRRPPAEVRPVPPPVRDLVSVQASWRAEHEFTSPAPALRAFVPPAPPAEPPSPTVLTWSQPPMERDRIGPARAAPQAGQTLQEPVE
jgi:hypothetical protein